MASIRPEQEMPGGPNAHGGPNRGYQPTSGFRVAISVVIITLLVFYTGGILTGKIGAEQRIDAVHLTLIGLTIALILVLLYPRQFARLRLLEGAGIRLEFERVKERQLQQGNELEFIGLILPVLLPEKERKHLLNLAAGKTKGYRGADYLRTELRRLRSLGLIRMLPGRSVRGITDALEFDLRQFVELTDLGKRWIARIEEIESERPVEAV